MPVVKPKSQEGRRDAEDKIYRNDIERNAGQWQKKFLARWRGTDECK